MAENTSPHGTDTITEIRKHINRLKRQLITKYGARVAKNWSK